jgi:DNA-binding transcriptional ArsR family regulator
MDETQRFLSIAEIERWLLAALCSPALDHQKRAEILDRLASHKFAEPEHETIFRALVKMPRATSEHIRETLAARLTRLGFPDVDVEPIFDLAPPSPEQIRALLQQLSG